MTPPVPAVTLRQAANPLPPVSALPPLLLPREMINDPRLHQLADKLEAGQRLDLEDGLALQASQDLLGLGALAQAARLAKNGQRAYYVLNRHLNYSNICANKCTFCAFWRDEGQERAFLLSPAQAADKVRQVSPEALDELHVVGSCHPTLNLDYYLELLQALGQAQPRATLKAFTPVEIDHLAKMSGLEVLEVLRLLQAQGLAHMPGGGAEVFSPRVRAELCPKKISGQRWLEVSAAAHSLGIPTNATMLYGHIETPAERVEHLLALREQQDKSGGFSAFIPLAFHPENTGIAGGQLTTALDDLRMIASARLLLDNFPHIKAYWVMLGPKLAQVALNFGADDLDGTIIEERITHMAGATTSQGLTEAELRQMIEAAGCEPVRRDSFYNQLAPGLTREEAA